jgi:K+/H+ antiporter YhaU regulatory subunit KhtT
MFPIVSVLLTLGLAFLVVRVATVALTLTGLSKESARFQARSAFTGVGFTTTEAESIVNHPVRRRIIMVLMMLGNAGLVTVAASLMLSFLGQDGKGWLAVGALFAGVAALVLVSRSAWVERRMSTVIEWALRKWTHIDTQDYESLLRLSNGFSVAEFSVEEGDFVHGKSLLELPFKENGVIVLGIQRRNGSYIGAPRGTHRFETGDTAIVYGTGEKIERILRKQPDATLSQVFPRLPAEPAAEEEPPGSEGS